MAESLGTDPGVGISGTGTTVSGSATGPIGMLTKVGIAGFEASEIDLTTMNSPDKWRVFIAGLKDAKSINLDLVYEASNTTVLLDAFAGPNETWTVEFPDGSTFVVDGFIQRLGGESPNGDKIAQQVTIRLSGPPAFNEGSGA